ncbi:MAG: lysozyme [Arcticibacterium sp.]
MKRRKNHTTLIDKLLNRVSRFSFIYGFVLLLLLVSYPSSVIDGMRKPQTEEVKVKMPMRHSTHGIDISHYNGEINWEKVTSFKEHHSAVRFCFVKATEGTDLVDHRFQENWEALEETNIKRGAYHFFNPATNPRLQALNYILSVDLHDGDFAPVLDWEVLGRGRNRRNIAANVKIWLEVIEQHYGIKPIIYTNKHIYRDYIKQHFAEYPLWISHYEVPELQGYDLDQVYFWQHSMTGKLEGIETLVDFNVFIREDSEIERLIVRL